MEFNYANVCSNKPSSKIANEAPPWLIRRLLEVYAISEKGSHSLPFVYVGDYTCGYDAVKRHISFLNSPKFGTFDPKKNYVISITTHSMISVVWVTDKRLELFCPAPEEVKRSPWVRACFTKVINHMSVGFFTPADTLEYKVNGQCFQDSNVWTFYFLTQRVTKPPEILDFIFSDCEPTNLDKAVKVYCTAVRALGKSAKQTNPDLAAKYMEADSEYALTEEIMNKMQVLSIQAQSLNQSYKNAKWAAQYLEAKSEWYRFAEIDGAQKGRFFIKD